MNAAGWGLYLLAVLIWGSTWLLITFQLGKVAPEASIVYRFALAALVMFGWSAWRGLTLRFDRAAHIRFALQGAFLFCLNYVLFYHSERFISSGLVALICSGIAFFNMFGMRLLYGQAIAPTVALGSSIGIAGIMVVFWPEVRGFSAGHAGWLGIALAAIATFSASCGNLVSVSQRRANLPVLQSTAWAMLYGTLLTGLYALLAGIPFGFDFSLRYLGSLAYLVLFGSVVAFMSYLTLIARVGAAKAAYVNVTVPIVALILSALVEGFRWQLATFVGIGLSLLGNLLVMQASKR
ncbi:DMT family transporter [Permianibacter sp. IMCC34836]|uniref:DMT family transporter n=1 Tax=Permianibacter fluminis TaxID=2738515 RepID=UPI0015577D2D|nr:DMT family transporter [Permianibacter fluminis]NQD38629.1 DMT family transporter [Permianibacter fluminis]